ncbi:MAG: gliding motility-associated ABC transporter substrate-binding protein GldG, partial [Odoribacter sp.]|nr:gliding motility-associated ABC transporter substrate-binding protein GldG [Odoribacter sp.]
QEGKDKKTLQDFYKQLMQKGIVPTNIQVKEKGGAKQQIIFPAAIVTYKGKEMPLQLLMTQYGLAPEAQINSSIQALEFNLANVIKKLTIVRKPKIAFIEGQGELDRYETASISFALSEYYSVDRVKINHQVKALKDFKLIIIAKPDSAFEEKDKFVIDQFIMKGGKVLWLIDPVFASMDSLRTGTDETLGIGNQLNLDDQLFQYGVRYNYDLLLDLSAMQIPVKTGSIGNQPQYGFMPWYFFPLINPVIKHPINNNLNLIKTEFVSSLDTLKTRGVKKTILLTTSQLTKRIKTPAVISLNIMKQAPDEQEYNKSYLPVAVLLEGEFKSVFVNGANSYRIPPEITDDPEINFKDKSVKNKMIVITDGDII